MVVTISAPSLAALRRGEFQAMLMGLTCETFEGNKCMDIVLPDDKLWKAKHLAGMIDGDILAINQKVGIHG